MTLTRDLNKPQQKFMFWTFFLHSSRVKQQSNWKSITPQRTFIWRLRNQPLGETLTSVLVLSNLCFAHLYWCPEKFRREPGTSLQCPSAAYTLNCVPQSSLFLLPFSLLSSQPSSVSTTLALFSPLPSFHLCSLALILNWTEAWLSIQSVPWQCHLPVTCVDAWKCNSSTSPTCFSH